MDGDIGKLQSREGFCLGKSSVQVPSWVGFGFLKWIVLILSQRVGSPVFLLTGGSS